MKLVVDSNIVIAGILRDSITRKILFHPLFSFYIPDYSFIEIDRHMDELIEKSGLTKHRFHQVVDKIKENLIIIPEQEFDSKYPKAFELMCKIDEADVPFIALALSFDNDGIWSNDVHFEKQNQVRIWTTKDLIEELRELEEELHY